MFDDRFARQNRYGLPPEFPLASPYTGIVHHLSGPNRYALRESGKVRRPHAQPRDLAGRDKAPPSDQLHFHFAPWVRKRHNTRTHVRLLGPCFKTGQTANTRCLQPRSDNQPPNRSRSRARASNRNKPNSQPSPPEGSLPGRLPLTATTRTPKPSKVQAHRSRKTPRSVSISGECDPHAQGADTVRGSLSTLSGTFQQPLQLTFHLSFTVLVRYRSLVRI